MIPQEKTKFINLAINNGFYLTNFFGVKAEYGCNYYIRGNP